MNIVNINKKSVIPSKIVCIGRNYYQHISELGNEIPDQMVIFCKSNSAISDNLTLDHQQDIHYEAELSFMVENGEFCALGFGFDLTKRELQSQLKSKSLPWERSKSFDGSAVFSSFIPIKDIDPSLSFSLSINGVIVQQGNLELMIHSPEKILKEIQTFMSLEDGDIVMTGTPKGVGVLKSGDVYQALIRNEQEILLEQQWTVR
ncbi:fumarylacetoacetate hydrolase family protein [Candidatus Thioglobus sp.]|nr:fumarylacetoacetate hydrolase family protein [Candidatus Thioglobus sp.]MDB3893723.1 fumarylacetoacetate hydrolase family protein [Candidatus Thioglobus sp.]MDB9829032.1 fumarylacetoacetate hydrolase family protein [Candidatus Thioglobus sp.]MDC0920658.1 fumarylacetoacetate hydrolase family protein [Candidatus Thioglobus sp.]MDC0965767.1 fumarylacetoacetate hydrolase family protein [Candidatus Thioglobus sp.]